MAATAETQEITQTYIAIDAIPKAAEMREDVRSQAWQTIEQRREQLHQGNQVEMPLTVDAISTAHTTLEAKRRFGKNSLQYQELFAGLQLDCQRLLAEWFRKNKPEYFAEVYHRLDSETQDFYSHGLSIRQMTENALLPHDNNPEEEARRVNERVEEATPQILRGLGGLALRDVRVRTISECTDTAIANYQHDRAIGAPHRGYNGYVPEIEKLMIRDMRLDEATGGRFEEQVGLPGIYIQHSIIQEAIRRRGVEAADKDKTALHGTQLLVKDDLIEFVELLDTVASEEWCTPIFMGEAVPENHPKNYAAIREEARQRQAGLANQVRTIALFTMELAEQGTDRREAPAIVEAFVKRILLGIAEEDNSLATDMFDEQTAQGLREVAFLRSMGYEEEASARYEEVEQAAPGGGFCGAGSCGLESVAAGGADEKAAKELGFGNAKDLIKDKERACPHCKNKSVIYDTKQGKKGCTSCHKTAKY